MSALRASVVQYRQAPAAPAHTFGAVLQRFRLQAGLTQIELGRHCGLAGSYVNRLESGGRNEPSFDVMYALVCGLRLSVADADKLYLAAGHVPPSWQKLGYADTTLAALVEVLTNDRLSPEARADFRAVVEVIAERWMCAEVAGRVAGREGN